MPVPRQGDPLCPTGAVVLEGRRGVLDRQRPGCSWRRGECTWCGSAVRPGGRRTLWCSQACVDAFKITTPAGQLAALEARDRGVCTSCGLVTERLRAACRRWLRTFGADRSGRVVHQRNGARHRLGEILTLRRLPTSERALRHLMCSRRVWWDGDHTIPIADGGHPCDLANLRTLCWWCHKRETAEAATRRAEARRLPAEEQLTAIEVLAQLALFDPG